CLLYQFFCVSCRSRRSKILQQSSEIQQRSTLSETLRLEECCGTCTCVTECVDVQMCGLVADGIVQHTAVGVFILIFHLQR
ncbi:hypothetical protein PO909_028084, partial [Leuciscus waleckii]